MRLGLGKW